MQDLQQRIKSSVKIDEMSGCWIWQKAKVGTERKRSYGKITIGKKHIDRKNALAHRVSYMVFIGNIPDGLQILHKCDNPSCVNPEHLSLGTNQDNVNDREMKGRTKGWGARKNNIPMVAG